MPYPDLRPEIRTNPECRQEELCGWGARGGLAEHHLVRRILVGERGQPHCRKHGGRGRRNHGLHERQADVTQGATMLRGMVMFVFEGEGRNLCAQNRAHHQDNE